MDELPDNVRRLPGETGVIDITGFLQALDRIGYAGPISVEPFYQRISEMANDDAARETAEAVRRCLDEAGVAL